MCSVEAAATQGVPSSNLDTAVNLLGGLRQMALIHNIGLIPTYLPYRVIVKNVNKIIYVKCFKQ